MFMMVLKKEECGNTLFYFFRRQRLIIKVDKFSGICYSIVTVKKGVDRMVTKCYLLCSDEITLRAVAKLVGDIPCFVDAKAMNGNRFELYIQCRREDIAAVERRLAQYV